MVNILVPKQCAWCNQPITEEPGKKAPITQNICQWCKINLEFPDTSIKNLLEKFSFPVMCLDETKNVVSANSIALDMLNQSEFEIAGKLGGEVIHCIHAELEEGCGNTIHCAGCTIRNTVIETQKTGEGKEKVESFQYVRDKDGKVRKQRMLVSTDLFKDFVLFQIDEVEYTDE